MGETRHRSWMRQALAAAARADGSVSPNPRVGCLLVKNDAVVGCGYHRGPGRPHAEAEAISAAAGLARGATAYVTLEPCAHRGQTPPCANALVEAGVARVFAAMRDPDPRVDGKGFDILRAAGIEVSIGCLSDDAERLNEGFLHWHRTSLPFVTLKAATTLDGRLSARDGESRWISSEASRNFAHRLRWEHDAILVGAGTVRRDNPSLTVRLRGDERHRPIVVLSASGDLDPASKIFRAVRPEGSTPSLFVYSTSGSDLWSGRAHVGRIDSTGALSTMLRELGAFGIRKLLVEGGGETFRHFLDQDLVQRLALFQAPLAVGGAGATPLIGGLSVPRPADGFYWRRQQSLPLDGDLFTSFVRADAAAEGR